MHVTFRQPHTHALTCQTPRNSYSSWLPAIDSLPMASQFCTYGHWFHLQCATAQISHCRGFHRGSGGDLLPPAPAMSRAKWCLQVEVAAQFQIWQPWFYLLYWTSGHYLVWIKELGCTETPAFNYILLLSFYESKWEMRNITADTCGKNIDFI